MYDKNDTNVPEKRKRVVPLQYRSGLNKIKKKNRPGEKNSFKKRWQRKKSIKMKKIPMKEHLSDIKNSMLKGFVFFFYLQK